MPTITSRPGRRAGFTMVELLVAVVIASVVVAGLYGLFTVQTRQFLFQDLQMEIHQNQRFATDIVSRSIRLAGFGTSGRVVGYLGHSDSSDNPLPVVMSHDAWSASGTDGITVVYGDPSVGMGTNPTFLPNCETTQLKFQTGVRDYADRLSSYAQDEMIMCLDYASLGGMTTYLWVLSSAPSGDGTVNVYDGTSNLDFVGVCPVGENISPAMYCSKAQIMTFYVDDDNGIPGPGTPEKPVLMLDLNLNWPSSDDIPLVENVEDLQFEYCLIDADGDGNTDDCTAAGASWVDSITHDQGGEVQMVRMHLLVRSSREDPTRLFVNSVPALANRSPGGETDSYYRQVLTSEITVRNLRAQANL